MSDLDKLLPALAQAQAAYPKIGDTGGTMATGDRVLVHGRSYSGTRWVSEAHATLLYRTSFPVSQSHWELGSGERIEGPFEEWHVKFEGDEDGPGETAVRWIRQSDVCA